MTMHAGTLRRWMLFAPLFLLLALSALVLGACGDDDDDDGGGDSGGSTSAGTGSDEDYVKTVCVSFTKYIEDFGAAASKDPASITDPVKAMKVAAPLLEDLANNLSKAKPPKDVKSYHDDLVKSMRDVAKKAKDGKIDSLDELGALGDDAPEPSQAIQDRLDKAAAKVDECNEGGVDLFGS